MSRFKVPYKDLLDMFLMQAELDSMIIKKHSLQEKSAKEMAKMRQLAFIVELSEYANETRVFKYWSVKDASEHSVVLEEYVDGLHFVLSLGLLKGYGTNLLPDFFLDLPEESTERNRDQITKQMLDVVYYATVYEFNSLIKEFLRLGFMWGFSWDEIVRAYKKKYETNIKRQDSGTY